MDTIKNYLETLFLTLPKTPQTQQAKADLLATMEDHYHGLIEEGKSESEAIGAVISEFGSIDELREELELGQEEAEDAGESGAAGAFAQSQQAEKEAAATEGAWSKAVPDPEDFNWRQAGSRRGYGSAVSLAEVEEFWQMIRQFALRIAGGILLGALGFAGMIFFMASMSEGIGATILFIGIAAAVASLIHGGMLFSRVAKPLAGRPYDEEVQLAAAYHVGAYRKSFSFSLIGGIAALVLSFAPIFLFSYSYQPAFGAALFFAILGLGAFMIIYGSIIYAYYRKFANGQVLEAAKDDYPQPSATEHQHPLFTAFTIVYWPAVVLFYFLLSFGAHAWAWSWTVFMIAGPVYAAIQTLVQARDERG